MTGRPYEVLDFACDTRRGLLERAVFHGIVFNMSWEDPEMDRQALLVQPSDAVISITSAGCNPLNLLCQNPRRLISIDSNPAQNALLELKLATIAAQDHEALFDIFAMRRPGRVLDLYRPRLRPMLSQGARSFWDRNLWMVSRGICNFGKMGVAARVVRLVLALLGINRRQTNEFFELCSLREQKRWYGALVEPRLWGPLTRHLCQSQWFMFLCGVHPRQLATVADRHGIYEFVRERIEYALTRVPIYDNYFLSATVTGKFRGDRVPPYLLAENFAALRRNLERVTVVNGWLGPYLDSLPGASIDKFNLLDILDWMDAATFEKTLQSVLRAARPGARMIYRSGNYENPPPDSILPHVRPHTELARRLLATDRSATYGSFYVFSIEKHEPTAMAEIRAGLSSARFSAVVS